MQVHHPTLTRKNDKLNTFNPIILFHEHTCKDESHTDGSIIRICQDDEYKKNKILTWKKRVDDMLCENSRIWQIVFSNVREYENRNRGQSQQIQLSTTIYSHPQDQSIDCLTKKRRRGNLPKAVTALLKDWLSRHRKHPYPTEEEKLSLAKETKLTLQQISNWFINARRRHLPHLLENDFNGGSRNQRSPDLDLYYEADSTEDSDNGRLNMRNHAKCSRITKAGGVKKPYSRRKASF